MELDLLKIKGLSYEYPDGQQALDGVDFSLAAGGNLALIGANGAGKSTLLQLIVGVLAPKYGEIFFDGELVTKKSLPDVRKKTGLIFQNAEHQLFCATIYEDIMFGPLNMGLSQTEADERVSSVLQTLRIEHLAKRAPYRLSAGEKRLCSIASVLSMQPKLLLMDEPTAELDPRARRELISLLHRLPQAKIIATHDLDFAVKACPRTIILHGGKIAADGETNRLLSDIPLLKRLDLY